MIIPLGDSQWLHMESNDVIAWNGTNLTITTPNATVYTIPQNLTKRVIRLLAFSYIAPEQDTITPDMAKQMGSEIWQADRSNM